MSLRFFLIALVFQIACGGDLSAAAFPASDSTFVAGDGARLAYSIDWPAGNGPFPAVVLVHGSGRVTRADHEMLSRQFTDHGWAVLRYDKRGVGASQGAYSGVGVINGDSVLRLLASDASAGLRLLSGHPKIDGRRLGFAGGSQAGWIIPLALAASPSANVGVILSGPTVSVGSEIYYSSLAEGTSLPLLDAYAALASFHGSVGFDPLPTLRTVRVPVLWLYGDDDRSIPTRTCLEIHDRLRQGGVTTFTVRSYPGLGHPLSRAIWTDVYTFLDRLR